MLMLLQICKNVIYIIGTKKKKTSIQETDLQASLFRRKRPTNDPKKKKKHYLTIEYLCKRSYNNKHI